MSLSEKMVKEDLTRDPDRYASRVRWLACVYFFLNLLSLGLIITIAWRLQFFIALAQRSNVETLVLAIVFVLAVYYLATTFRGFVGSLRIAKLNLPGLWARDDEARLSIERKKHRVLKNSRQSKSAYFDQAIRLKGKPDDPIRWTVGDSAGKLGELELNGVKATYHPLKDGMNDSLFEFLTNQLEQCLCDDYPDINLEIVEWGTISQDEAAEYNSIVQAFQNLERTLRADKPASPLWPTVELTQEGVSKIQAALDKIVPCLRNESLLPNVEYEVEWTVPILPEPLSFMQLRRTENRADPVFTMGCATLIVLVILSVIVFFIIFPPWVPSK